MPGFAIAAAEGMDLRAAALGERLVDRLTDAALGMAFRVAVVVSLDPPQEFPKTAHLVDRRIARNPVPGGHPSALAGFRVRATWAVRRMIPEAQESGPESRGVVTHLPEPAFRLFVKFHLAHPGVMMLKRLALHRPEVRTELDVFVGKALDFPLLDGQVGHQVVELLFASHFFLFLPGFSGGLVHFWMKRSRERFRMARSPFEATAPASRCLWYGRPSTRDLASASVRRRTSSPQWVSP